MEMKIVSCSRRLFAGDMLLHWYVRGYFFKGPAQTAAAVPVKIDKNSLISNKWAAEASCQVCNGILQRSAVPTGARVHPNPITYPDSGTFSHYGGGRLEKPARTRAGLVWPSLWDVQRVGLV